jgi:mono/diheme cytochrome c family protein
MLRTILCWMGIAVAGIGYLPAFSQTQVPSASSGPSPHRALVNRYCVTCHNERLQTANLMLDKMDLDNVATGAEVWEKVVRKLRTGAMPPAGAPRPEPAAYEALATYLETALDGIAAANPQSGKTAVHRLNRAEYANAIRDLLAMDMDGESLLPADDSSHGFDNIADVLSVSPTLLERYIEAAGKISRLAVGDRAQRAVAETYEVPKYLIQNERMSEDLPFGSRGGVAIRHYFPLDGEYSVKIRLQRNIYAETVIGLVEPHQLDVRLDGARIKTFTIGGGYKGKAESIYGERFPEEYLFSADDGMEIRFAAAAGPHVLGVSFVNRSSEPEGVLQPPLPEYRFVETSPNDLPAVGAVVVSGPYDAKGPGETPSRRKIFVCSPSAAQEEEPCARKILSALARRAYRRPVVDGDIEPLLGFYQSGRSKGSFDAGMEMALRKILVSPEFLFRIEHAPAGTPPDSAYRVSDLELASGLSFFLWSSIPDDELLGLAERGKLRDPAVLDEQVRRMLADTRSKALVSNFGGQWLYLRNVRAMLPDPEAFPDFDENLREALQQETELFLESIVREDRSALDLLDADYTFLNERLARHYGIAGVQGSHFRRVKLSDEQRRGLLGQGSILAVTSYANRTSPVLRGKWVLDNFLGSPPPPPPPNVPSLKDRGDQGQILTVRQRMEQHRANPACAVCHSRMDPLGFALENFDAIGRWRTTDAGSAIDSSGVLPDGTRFQGPAELRKVLLSKREQFVNTIAEKLLTYALGRKLEYSDAPAVRGITRQAVANGYRWSSLITGVIRSTPYQMRRSPQP